MTVSARRAASKVVPILAQESLYVGIDVGKNAHVAGFVSATLLSRHLQFEACPSLRFENSRAGFRQLLDRIQSYVPLEQCYVLLEKTGHYHLALVQYLQELDVSVYLVHVQERPTGMMKTDKRDALGLANHLYNQLDKGIQVPNKLQVIRRAVAPSEAAASLRGLMRHRYELAHEASRRKNKLTAICDQLFPEFTQVFRDPNLPTALAMRGAFPTPQAVGGASLEALQKLRSGHLPSNAKLAQLQELAAQSIGVQAGPRQQSLVFEQAQLIKELALIHEHLDALDEQTRSIVEHARDGRILRSIPGVGVVHAATLLAAIGHIDNFPTAASLKSYLGWAPAVAQTGTTMDSTWLGRGGTRPAKKTMFLVVGNAIQLDSEWKRLYDRLVPKKCSYDERTRQYKGKKKVMGRIAGQMISLMYALLKRDQEVLRTTPPGQTPPDPELYDPAKHKEHRQGQYRSSKPRRKLGQVIQLPPR